MRGCPEPLVGAVELESRRAVAAEAVVAENLAADAFEHPRDSRVAGFRALAIVRPQVVTLGGEADPTEVLRGAAVAAPQPAVLAVELVVVLPGLRRPRANAAFAAADLDDAALLGREGDLPVKPVAAEVAQPPAAVAVGFERIQGLSGVVLGMRARRDHPVVLQHLDAFVVQLQIGDDVVVVPLRLEPCGEVGVGGEVAHARAAELGMRVGDVADAHVQHRPMPGCDRDPAAVGVEVVGREPILGMVAGVVRVGIPCRGQCLPVLAELRIAGPVGTSVIPVDRVRESRHEHRDGRSARPLRRHHEERDVLPGIGRREHQRIGRRSRALGHRPLERRRPAAVVDVVFVKVDRRVLVRSVPPAHLAPAPPRAGHASGRNVDERTVEPVGAGVFDTARFHAAREVPARACAGDGTAAGERIDLVSGERAIEYRGHLELAVEVMGGNHMV